MVRIKIENDDGEVIELSGDMILGIMSNREKEMRDDIVYDCSSFMIGTGNIIEMLLAAPKALAAIAQQNIHDETKRAIFGMAMTKLMKECFTDDVMHVEVVRNEIKPV